MKAKFKSKFEGMTDEQAHKIAMQNKKVVRAIKDKLFAPIESRTPTHYFKRASMMILLCIALFSCNKFKPLPHIMGRPYANFTDCQLDNWYAGITDMVEMGKLKSFDQIFHANTEIREMEEEFALRGRPVKSSYYPIKVNQPSR